MNALRIPVDRKVLAHAFPKSFWYTLEKYFGKKLETQSTRGILAFFVAQSAYRLKKSFEIILSLKYATGMQ